MPKFPPAQLLTLVLAIPLPCGAESAPGIHFDIPAQSFSDAIIEFSRQAHVEIVYAAAQSVEPLRSRPLRGTLALTDALALLLDGTGFVFEIENPHSVLLHETPPEHLRKTADILPTATAPPPSEITITGSYLHGVLDLTSPLIFLKHSDLNRTAYATVQDALQSLPANLLSTRNEILGGADNFIRGTAPNLRGLGPGATLVLINGNRPASAGADGGFVDLSTIPWSTVDHIEVLPDGASALYGSDAIAGVINILLRDHLQGAEIQLRSSLAPNGAHESLIAQTFGNAWDTGHALITWQYTRRTALAATDRAYTASADKRLLGGSDFRSSNSNPGNLLDPYTLQPAFAIPQGQDGRHLTPSALLPGLINLANPFDAYDLIPDEHAHALQLSATQALTSRLEAFVDASLIDRSVHYRDFPQTQILLVPSSNPFFIGAVGGSPFEMVAYDFSKDLGALEGDGHTLSTRAHFGLKASLPGEWRATLSANLASEVLRFTARNQINPQALQAALVDPDPATAFNPYGDGSHTAAATLDDLRLNAVFHGRSELTGFRLIADGALFPTPGGDARIALGIEARHEGLQRAFGKPSSSVDANAISADHYGRAVTAAFSELSVPLIGQPDSPRSAPRLELSLAGRSEHYSDFGDTFNPKIGLRFMPTRSLKLRTSRGSAFRAPKLVDLYDRSNTASALAILPDPHSPTGVTLIAALQGNNPQLHEETATIWTSGLDLAPDLTPGLTASLTYYHIDYRNQVVQPGPPDPAGILLEADRWSAVIERNPTAPEVAVLCRRADFMGSVAQCLASAPAAIIDFRLRNLATTHTAGVDLNLDYNRRLPLGALHLKADLTRILQFERGLTPTSPTVSVLGTVANPPTLRAHVLAEWSRTAGADRDLSASLAVNHLSASRDRQNPLRRDIGAWTTLDLQLRYAVSSGANLDGLDLALGIANLLDRPPPFVNTAFGYDLFNAQPYGRILSVSLQKSW